MGFTWNNWSDMLVGFQNYAYILSTPLRLNIEHWSVLRKHEWNTESTKRVLVGGEEGSFIDLIIDARYFLLGKLSIIFAKCLKACLY